MALLAALPDARIELRDMAVHESADLGLRIGTIWLPRGTYSGLPVCGPVNDAPVSILGSSHFELWNGRVVWDWRTYDEIAVIAQILRGSESLAP